MPSVWVRYWGIFWRIVAGLEASGRLREIHRIREFREAEVEELLLFRDQDRKKVEKRKKYLEDLLKERKRQVQLRCEGVTQSGDVWRRTHKPQCHCKGKAGHCIWSDLTYLLTGCLSNKTWLAFSYIFLGGLEPTCATAWLRQWGLWGPFQTVSPLTWWKWPERARITFISALARFVKSTHISMISNSVTPPLEFVFQEQSYSSLHSGRSLA